MPSLMAALPNIGGARGKVWLTPTTRVPCSNAAKTPNPLKFIGVPQTTGSISAAMGRSSPYYEDMWRTFCCLTSFFPIIDTCLNCEDVARHPPFPQIDIIGAVVIVWRVRGKNYQVCSVQYCVQQLCTVQCTHI